MTIAKKLYDRLSQINKKNRLDKYWVLSTFFTKLFITQVIRLQDTIKLNTKLLSSL